MFDSNPKGLQTRNELCAAVWKLITLARKQDPKTRDMSAVIWEALRRQMRAMRITPFGTGMEDAHEGFVKFLDAFDAPEIEELFEFRYRCMFRCGKCGESWETEGNDGKTNQDVGTYRKLQYEDFQSGRPLEDMLLQQEECAEDVKCHKCGVKCDHTRIDRLVFIPEVIIPLFAKYTYSNSGRVSYIRWSAKAPEQLTIPGLDDTTIPYRLMALSEHSGNTEGGHYWAHARRDIESVEQMVRLDDTSIGSPGDVSCSATTYLAWYHAV